jgi:hypothetical protein
MGKLPGMALRYQSVGDDGDASASDCDLWRQVGSSRLGSDVRRERASDMPYATTDSPDCSGITSPNSGFLWVIGGAGFVDSVGDRLTIDFAASELVDTSCLVREGRGTQETLLLDCWFSDEDRLRCPDLVLVGVVAVLVTSLVIGLGLEALLEGGVGIPVLLLGYEGCSGTFPGVGVPSGCRRGGMDGCA